MNQGMKMKLSTLSLSLLFALASPLLSQEPEAAPQMNAIMQAFSNLPKEKRMEYQEHRAKAEQYFGQKRTFECLEEIYKGIKIFDQDAALWNLQGSCYVEFRSFEKAKESFRRSLALQKENTGVLFNLAEMDFVTKNWKGASAKFGSLSEALKKKVQGEMEGPLLELHQLALFKKMLSEIKLGNLAEAEAIAKNNSEEWDDTPFTYYSKAALAYHADDQEAGNDWVMSAVRVFGGMQGVANWQDTLIEIGYIKSFYGGEKDENAPDLD